MKSRISYLGIFALLFMGFRLAAFTLYAIKSLGSLLEEIELDEDELDIKETL